MYRRLVPLPRRRRRPPTLRLREVLGRYKVPTLTNAQRQRPTLTLGYIDDSNTPQRWPTPTPTPNANANALDPPCPNAKTPAPTPKYPGPTLSRGPQRPKNFSGRVAAGGGEREERGEGRGGKGEGGRGGGGEEGKGGPDLGSPTPTPTPKSPTPTPKNPTPTPTPKVQRQKRWAAISRGGGSEGASNSQRRSVR